MSTLRKLTFPILALGCGLVLTLLAARPAAAAGVVTNCATYGPGPGTLYAAVNSGEGLVVFACSGTIEVPQINLETGDWVFDGTGQEVVLDAGGTNRIFLIGNLGKDDYGNLWINNLTLANGKDSLAGGAISNAGNITITNSAILSNTAPMGGAIATSAGKILIENSTIAYNTATGTTVNDGGGAVDMFRNGEPIFDTGLTLTIRFSTIVGNRSAAAGQGAFWIENGMFTLERSILFDSGGVGCKIEPMSSGPEKFRSIGNLADDATCTPTTQADPKLTALGDNGGPTLTFALQADSPAIDAAGADTCAGTTDQRSLLRPRDGNGDGGPACDLGAYEYGTRHRVNAYFEEGLGGYWKFDEGAGTQVMDSAGNGMTGVLSGNPTFNADHPTLRFSNPYSLQGGPGTAMTVADDAYLDLGGDSTVAAWIRLNNTANATLIAKQPAAGTGPGYALSVENGRLKAEGWGTNGEHRTVTAPIVDNAWLHVALVWKQADALRLYVNGNLVASAPTTGTIDFGIAPLRVTVDGRVDDLRVYNRALPGGAIMALSSGRSCVNAGSAWSDAVNDLQCVLAEAQPGDEIWVARGVYPPTRGPDRNATFTLRPGMTIYGGFNGNERSFNQRSPMTLFTVLTGDVQGNDDADEYGIVHDPSKIMGGNAYHVVTVLDGISPVVLDGVVVTGGQATGGITAQTIGCGQTCGGGIYSPYAGAPQLRNLALLGNQASGNGGALYAGAGEMALLAARFQGNQAGGNGGSIYLNGGAPTLANVLVGGSLATLGGGLYSANASPHIVNFTAAGNHATAEGGGATFVGGDPTVDNGLVAKNSAPVGPQLSGAATLRTSLVEGGCLLNFSCPGVQTFDPLFVAPNDPAVAPNGDGNFALQPTSPAIDIGNSAVSVSLAASVSPAAVDAGLGTITTDIVGNPRLASARMPGAIIDLGAYEMPNLPPVFQTVAITQATTTLPYTYTVTVVDPNWPDGHGLQFNITEQADWLTVTGTGIGQALLAGTPGREQIGAFPVKMTATDAVGATTEQNFDIFVRRRVYPLYLPAVSRH